MKWVKHVIPLSQHLFVKGIYHTEFEYFVLKFDMLEAEKWGSLSIWQEINCHSSEDWVATSSKLLIFAGCLRSVVNNSTYQTWSQQQRCWRFWILYSETRQNTQNIRLLYVGLSTTESFNSSKPEQHRAVEEDVLVWWVCVFGWAGLCVMILFRGTLGPVTRTDIPLMCNIYPKIVGDHVELFIEAGFPDCGIWNQHTAQIIFLVQIHICLEYDAEALVEGEFYRIELKYLPRVKFL